MKFNCSLRHPLHRDGTNQYQRMLDELWPDFAQIDARSIRERLRFVVEYAKQVQFYDLANQPDGDWQAFFDATDYLHPDLDDAQWLAWYQGLEGAMEPHMALFFGFLEMFQYAIDHLNTLTKRHLDFYYHEILQLPVRAPKPDEMHVLVELAQKVAQHKLSKGDHIEAGRDAAGKPLKYSITRELVANRAQVARISAIYVDHHAEEGERIYVAQDVRSADGFGKAFESDTAKWRMFGQPQRRLQAAHRTMADAQPGILVCSPVLALAEGERRISIRISLPDLDTALLDAFTHFRNSEQRFFELELSTDKGWYAPSWQMERGTDSQGVPYLHIHGVSIPPSAPAITPGKKSGLGLPKELASPAFRLRMKPGMPYMPYRVLSQAHIGRIDIEVEVKGAQQLTLKGETADFPAGRPFFPWGATPSPGDRFYVGHAESLSKQTTALSLHVEWSDLPASFESHYAGYGHVQAGDFHCQTDLLWDGAWIPLNASEALFPASGRVNLIDPNLTINLPAGFGKRKPVPPVSEAIHQQTQGFIRLQLNSSGVPFMAAFGHREYPALVTLASVALSQPGGQATIPNTPYSPKIRSIKLDYTAKDSILTGVSSQVDDQGVWHLEPMGAEIQAFERIAPALLPALDAEAYACLGLSEAVPGSTISVLFQMAEGSGNNWLDMRDAGVQWEYLAGESWKPLSRAHVLFDGTDSFLQTGIVQLVLPYDIAESAYRMPGGLLWLRVSIGRNAAGVPACVGVHTQAVHAVLSSEGNAPEHLSKPLEAGRTLRLEAGHGPVKGLSMPYSSFGGVPAENDRAYYTRVSERLRHKQRAITVWDYERMVLEAFPEVFKVKCIPHSNSTSEFSAGAVSVIVVPKLLNVNAVDPFKPAVGQGKLREIHQYLSRHLPWLFVDLVVENPSYEEIQLEFKVGFHPGYDLGYYGQLLEESIKRYLAPWAFEEGKDLVFGGTIHKSAIIKFIEDQPYVDFVVDFLVYQNTNNSNFSGINWMEIECNFIVSAPDVSVVEATSERSVLIPASKHKITVLEPGVYPCDRSLQCTKL